MGGKPDKAQGFTVTYDGFSVGFAANRTTTKTNIYASTQSREFKFSDSLTAQGALSLGYSEEAGVSSFNVWTSLKAAYAMDKVDLSGAVDLQYVNEKFDADVALKAVYAPVTFDFYYATKIKAAVKDNIYADTTDILAVKAVADLATFDVPVMVTVEGRNLINDARILNFKATTTAVKDFELGAYFNDIFAKSAVLKKQQVVGITAKYTGVEKFTFATDVSYALKAKLFAVALDVTYTEELFKAYAGIKTEFASGTSEFAGRLGASTDKLVDNAKMACDLYFNGSGLYDGFKPLGASSALTGNFLMISCTVEF